MSDVASADGTRSRADLLSLSPEELCVSLSRFVQEVSRPCGGRYSPDSILYLCLAIQKVSNQSEAETKLLFSKWLKCCLLTSC